MRNTLALATLFAYTTAIALQTDEDIDDTPLVSVCVGCSNHFGDINYYNGDNDGSNENSLP